MRRSEEGACSRYHAGITVAGLACLAKATTDISGQSIGYTAMPSREEFLDVQLDSLDLNLLRVFVVLIQQRSVTKAAEQLGRTQSAVSHSLAKLREFFQDDLFNRDSGVMEPTARAKELAQVVTASLSNIRAAVEQHMNFDAATTRRNFRIGVNDNAALAYIPGLTNEFIVQAPNATLNVIHVHESQVSSLIRAREIDYAIVAADGIADSRLELMPLSRDRLLCVGWKGNPAMRAPLLIDEYLQSLHVQVSADGISPGAADRVLQARRLRRRVVATIPHYLVTPSILKNTNLLAILGDSILFALGDDSELIVTEPPFKLPRLNICLVYDPVRQSDDGHTWLRDLIIEIWQKQRIRKRELMARFAFNAENR